ncbi:Inosine/uridine-preferring nucleoside hydrolase domain-containing protein [Escherichia coli]|nr:Pyrimidine-specific ribonucleoside hydrolase RihB [Escherichia coli]
MEKRKIILDCDPGHDDAIAIMMAAKHPAIDLLGITIVAGNQTLDKTLINGLNVCQKLEINVPVYAGMPQCCVCLQSHQRVTGNARIQPIEAKCSSGVLQD